MKKITVHKPNQLIELVGNPITAKGLLGYNFLLHRFQQEKTDQLTISMSEIFNKFNMGDNYDDLYKYLDSLQRIRVESRDERGRIWGAFNLLSEFKKRENGYFVAIPPTIFEALCGKNKNNERDLYYTTIQLLEQRIYKCSYTIIFYELFKKYEKVNIPKFPLSELKNFTGTQDKYDLYYEFKRNVLNKALVELNKFDNKYQYSFEEIKLAKKVIEIQFIRTFRTTKEVIEIIDSKPMKRIIDIPVPVIKKSKPKVKKEKIEKKEPQKVIEVIVEETAESILKKEKEKTSLAIKNTNLPTLKRLNLFGILSEINSMEDLLNFRETIKNIIDI